MTKYKRLIFLFTLTIQIGFSQEALSKDLNYYVDEGRKCYSQYDFKCAISFWEKGLDVARSIGNKQAISSFLIDIGNINYALGNNSGALSYYEEALKISKEIGDRGGEGDILNNIGNTYKMDSKNYSKALKYYEQALKISTELGDALSESYALGNIGIVNANLGNYSEALKNFKKILEIHRSLGVRKEEGVDLHNIANIYRDSGNYQEALKYYEQSLKIRKEIGDRDGEGNVIYNIGTVYKMDPQNYPEALKYYEQALKIFKELGDRSSEGRILYYIGDIYNELWNHTESLRYANEALDIAKELKDRDFEGNVLSGIGINYQALGNYPEAFRYFEQTLNIAREFDNRQMQGHAICSIGSLYLDLGEFPKGLENSEQALKIMKQIGDRRGETGPLNDIGIMYYDLGNYQKALEYFEQGLKIDKETGNLKGEGVSFTNIGLVYYDAGNYTEALRYTEQALKIYIDLGLLAYIKVAEGHIGYIYLEQGKIGEAYNIFQRLDNPSLPLGTYYLIQKEYVKAKEAFTDNLEVNKTGKVRFILADYIGLGLSYEGLKDYSKAKEYYQSGIDFIEEQRGRLSGEKRETFLTGKVMGFSRLEPYEGMVRVLLKEGAKGSEAEALQYAERVKSRLFLEQLAVRELKGRTKQDAAVLAKDHEFQQQVGVLKKRISVLEELGTKAPEGEKEQLSKELETAAATYEQFLEETKLKDEELSSLITVAAVTPSKLQGLLDADTSLLEYYTGKDKTYAWLVTRNDVKAYEIKREGNDLADKDLTKAVDAWLVPNISKSSRRPAPVITVAADDTYTKETSGGDRERNRELYYQAAREFYDLLIAPIAENIKTDKLIIVPHGVLHKVPFAALTDGSTCLVDRYSLSVLPAASVLEYVVKKRRPNNRKLLAFANPVTDYAPLGFSEAEVDGISKLFSEKEVYTRTQATEGMAKERSSTPDVIHFACHGEFNDKQPLQSGLFLAKDQDNDGYLQVHEIFGMNLQNANLVTLSACETALCKIQGGDDLVGLSRGFIYAGTPSILATLWSVDDRSTSMLMKSFYENWLVKGMSKPEALRQAQIALKDIPDYKHPYYWAPFVMIGDWK